MSLKPKQLVFGESGLRRYFGAQIDEDLVVFENVQYGNAVYILFKEWKETSKLSRLELLSGIHGDTFERVVHVNGWEDKIRAIIDEHKKE